jgi:proline utilization trans-activator
LKVLTDPHKEYLGDSSSTSLGLRFRDLISTFRTGLDSGIAVEPTTHEHNNFSIHRRGGSNHPTIPLPPFDFAKRLYAAQYSYIGTIFSFTDPGSFEENLREFYEREPDFTDRNDRLAYCQILLVLAFGQMYSVNQWTSHNGPPGFEYFQQALQLLPDIHEQGSVTFVEVLSLVGYFFQNLNLRDVAFLYVSKASPPMHRH